MSLYFIILVLKQVNAVVVVIISMIHIQKMCVPDAVENLNVKLFNLLRTNEKRHIIWHETCKCKCRLDASVCNKTKMEWR